MDYSKDQEELRREVLRKTYLVDYIGNDLTPGFYVDSSSFSHYYFTGQIFSGKFAVCHSSSGTNHHFSSSATKNFQRIENPQEYLKNLREDVDCLDKLIKRYYPDTRKQKALDKEAQEADKDLIRLEGGFK
ncbi:MAG: hypothetical protein WC781_03225 [Candidatus Pacearchaeota archaeon]|jgi:hypothetical protein